MLSHRQTHTHTQRERERDVIYGLSTSGHFCSSDDGNSWLPVYSLKSLAGTTKRVRKEEEVKRKEEKRKEKKRREKKTKEKKEKDFSPSTVLLFLFPLQNENDGEASRLFVMIK